MARTHAPFLTFNAGLVSPLALARVDVARLKFAAEEQTNWTPRVLGPVSLRNGLGYLETTKDNAETWPITFIFAADDKAIIEMVGAVFRVRVDDELVERAAVTAAVTNGDFGGSSGWTLTNSGGASSSIASGELTLSAVPLGSRATAQQTLTINQVGTRHALRIVVTRGPVGFRIGTAGGEDDILTFTLLGTGTHSLAFTPSVSPVYIKFESAQRRDILVDACEIESSGIMELPIPWGASDLDVLSYTQSGDVVFIACEDFQQRKIERRAADSWSIVLFQPIDGPFRINASDDLLITPSATAGNITLSSSAPFFNSDLEGSLLRLFQTSQIRTRDIGAEDTFTEAIRVTGVGGVRSFTLTIAGTWVGTLTLQRSADGADFGFTDVSTYTANTTTSINDGFDNSIIWYRVGFKAGAYTSGTASITLSYPGGGASGKVRILDVTTNTTATAEVLDELSSTSATRDWQEGDWSDKYGWPTSVALYEGRLWWFGRDRVWASISDAFESFDIDFAGDAGPIVRSIGYGPVEVINWGLPLARLVLGLQGSEASVRSSRFDEPLAPANFGIKDFSTQGSARVTAIKVDTRGIFIQKSKRRVYQIMFNLEEQDFQSVDLTALIPDIDSNLTQIAVQRQPDTRIHILREDGAVMVLVFEQKEEVFCWYKVETDGVIEHMVVLPDEAEDRVYYYVRRTINGQTVRYIEKFALDSECVGGTLNRQADAFIAITQASSTTITGLSHLEGEEVVVWANGKDLGNYTVTSNQITGVSEAVTTAIVGLEYVATFKSAKLAYGAQLGTALTQIKRIDHVGLILYNTHAQGIEHGQSFTTMDNLPMMRAGAAIDEDEVFTEFDEPLLVTPGKWDTDSRLCLRATAPRPCTVLGAVVAMTTHE